MALKDFDSYQKAQAYASECYKDQTKWQKMSLANIAGAGILSADRSVEDYARDIWGLSKQFINTKIIGQLLGAAVRFFVHIRNS